MKINYGKISNESSFISSKCNYEFKITSSILKKHYKELARMSMLFNVKEYNHGYIKKENDERFLILINEIKESDNKKCEASHKRAANKYKKALKFNCDHGDLGSLGYSHGSKVKCPNCGQITEVW